MNSGVVMLSRLRHGCISRSYRRLEISLSGRCSLKPRPLTRLPSCILCISHDSRSLRPEERRRKMLSASILFQREKLRRPHSSSRYSEHELPHLKLCSRDSDYVLEFRDITFEDARRESSERDHSNI